MVLGDLTYRLARDRIEVEFMPPLELKGKAEPVPAYRLVSASGAAAAPSVDRGGTPFVGREAEMGRLGGGLDEAISGRVARLVTVVGDAGVGKSRLIREFATATEDRARLVRGRCLPYGDGITFWPLAEVIRDAAGITSEDTPRIATRRIDRLLERAATEDREAIVERVAAAINLSAAQFPVAELMWGGRRFLEALATDRPIVMLVDDLHWAEATFLDFLDQLVEAVEDASILILGSARHEISERHAEWAAAHEPTLINLHPLSEADASRIVEELLGSLEGSVRARIAAAAEGNPLYVEQIVSMLVETGAIERGIDGWVARDGAAHLQIPPTVQALVASRLDALRSEERAVVDPASVIGLSFPMDAVAELVDDELRPRLGADLDVLTSKQLVRRLAEEDVIYRFGHQIIRDTAYGSLLKRARAALHERFVTWAERVNKERGRELEFEEILGFHLEQAYQYRTGLGINDVGAREVGERAAAKLSNAGRRALGRGDLSAAGSLLKRSVDLLPADSAFRLELLVDLGETYAQTGRFDDAASVLDDAIAQAQRAVDARLEVRARLERAQVDRFRGVEGAMAKASQAALAAIATLEPLGDDAGLARAWRTLVLVEVLQGRLARASEATQKVIRHAQAAGDTRIASRAAPGIAYILLHGPTPVAEAIPQCEELLASVAGDRKTEAVIDSTLSVLRAMAGDFEAARELYRRGQDMLEELGGGIDAASTSIDSHRVELLAGDLVAAELELRRDYDNLLAIEETFFRSTISAQLAYVRWQAGDLEDAISLSQTAEMIGEADDAELGTLWRIARSLALAGRGESERARTLVDEAVALAKTTERPVLQAQALIALGQVHRLCGDAEDYAGPPLREALALFEAKGDDVSAARIRELVAQPA